MTGPLAPCRPSGLEFFWKRWSRVVPLYFVISAIPVGQAALAGALSSDKLIATFLFWPAAGGALTDPYLQVGWTLSFEMAFYTAVSLVLVGHLKRNLVIAFAVAAALWSCRLLFTWDGLQFLASPLFLEFGAGVALAAFRGTIGRLPISIALGLLACGCALLAAQTVSGTPDPGAIGSAQSYGNGIRRVFAFGVPAALIVSGALACERLCKGAVAATFAKLGDVSYSIYLVQFFALFQVAALWRALHWPASPTLLLTAGLLAATAAGVFVHRVVEQPIMRDLRRLRMVRASGALASASQGKGAI